MPGGGRYETEDENEPPRDVSGEPDEEHAAAAAPVEKRVDAEAGRHALEVVAGHLMHLIPGEMWLGEAESVVIWLDGAARDELAPPAADAETEGILPVVELSLIHI